jgi:uncharacterized membrane protein YgdD (TMEM256/DUF423 family)
MERAFLLLAALAGFIGVALGAFGAHALKRTLTPEMLAVFETGVRYQMYHAFALVAAAWAESRWHARAFRLAGWLFVAGILVFSGSLYALAFTGVKMFGAVTPLGGLAFLAGWAALAWGAWRATDARY